MMVYTVGQVAKLCSVAPGTVSRWFDSGRLKGYRIPGSQDRRIPKEYLVRFIEEHGFLMPKELEEQAKAQGAMSFIAEELLLIRQALIMHRNYVETRNVVLSAQDVLERTGVQPALSDEQQALAASLSSLVDRIQVVG